MPDAKLEVLLSAKDISASGFEAFKRKISSVVGSVFTLQGALKTFAGGYGLHKVYESLNKTINAASDLEEVTSKFDVVFKGQKELVRQWADELEDSYGLSERASRQYLASIQDLLVPMGLYPDAAARMSFETVKLSTDLGSFNNMPTAKVMEDIQSTLVGNYETMKKYGVVLNAASVKQKALEMGLARTEKELTAAHKAQAAFQIIVKSSSAAVGDTGRTFDQYANVSKRLDAQLENLSATLGKKFVKAATAAKSATAGVIAEINKLMEGPGIDDMIANAEARLSRLLLTQEEKERELQRKRIDRERRLQAERDRFLKRNIGPVDSKSAEVLGIHERLKTQDYQMSPTEIDIRNARRYLDYLRDIQSLRKREAHESKKRELEGFGVIDEPGPGSGTQWPAGDTGLEDARRLNDIERRILKPNWAKEKIDRELPYMTEYVDLWQVQAKDFEAVEERHWQVLYDLQEDNSRHMVELSQRTADAIEQNFSDFFFDAFTGKLKDLGDYFEAFCNSILRAWADVMGQMAKEWIFGGDSGGGFGSFNWGKLFGSVVGLFGGGSSGPIHLGAGGTTAFGMAGGGVINEHVVGVGLRSGASYEFGEGNVPEIVMPMNRLGSGSGGDTIQVTQHFHVSAIDERGVEQFLRTNQARIAEGTIQSLENRRAQRDAMRSLM